MSRRYARKAPALIAHAFTPFCRAARLHTLPASALSRRVRHAARRAAARDEPVSTLADERRA